MYTNDTRRLRKALFDVGGFEALRQSSAVVEEMSDHFPEAKRSQLDDSMQGEVEHYAILIDTCSAHTVIRHPELQVQPPKRASLTSYPKAFWKRHFSHRDRITWDEFWQCFPQILKK